MSNTLWAVKSTIELENFIKGYRPDEYESLRLIIEELPKDIVGTMLNDMFLKARSKKQAAEPAVGMQILNMETMSLVVWSGTSWVDMS